jgi:uncharacterized protein YeaO (DUF488 family)
MIRLKRVYEVPSKEDGFRILVDRLWPRGLSKVKAKIDLWLKDIAPSDQLRKWFGHEVGKWKDFKKKYQTELNDNKDLLIKIKQLEKEKRMVTILYSAKDEAHNNAIVLNDTLKKF